LRLRAHARLPALARDRGPSMDRERPAPAQDTLAQSVDTCLRVFDDLWDFARKRDIPLGCNVESVSLSRREIDASVELVAGVQEIMSD
ncbi:MAG: hypothetical protein R3324_10915, partial [Halobacteriales archaeon]|nr:hypothetical protein [Halobacteriales archaeon]